MRRVQPRVAILVAVTVVVLVGVGAYAVSAWRANRAAIDSAPPVASTALDAVLAAPHIVFRSTLPGNEYGLVAAVPLDDPDGARAFTDVACDRVDVAGPVASCLRTIAGIATRWEAEVLDSDWRPVETWGLPGIPSRTRLSDDGGLVATTSFVTGHSYATVGFSTLTEVHRADGTSLGNLEDFALTVDGAPFTAADRNIWGVTFVDDDAFYATAASQSVGRTWLVLGSLEDRTLTSLRDDAECPSISPDGTQVAYKKVVDTVGGQPVWSLAVLDLADGTETLLPATRGVDDQAAWLDDDTLLYGLSRADEPGTTDVWAVDTTPDATPAVLIPGAWSPAVEG
ncbi:hypothetical protein [Cellulomonas sp. Root137]|uniref:TolB family protein n=1 Tax=Cellulomonas sp. Root137 TaxID=1736459 RepID=UPI0006F4174D|nr:hypothetical protein [Cellulomonas sp. Root137]KQY42925.1 hypothetical protein ASD18_18280 [Cellulomonas sp. Root137]